MINDDDDDDVVVVNKNYFPICDGGANLHRHHK